jgi:hypothetical protein
VRDILLDTNAMARQGRRRKVRHLDLLACGYECYDMMDEEEIRGGLLQRRMALMMRKTSFGTTGWGQPGG